jgi:copper(I)-binding protein
MTTQHLARRDVLKAALAVGTAALLPIAPARACEFFCTSLRVTHPWTRASAAGADSAIVCMRLDEITESDRLIRVTTPVATGAEIVLAGGKRSGTVDLPLPAGQDITFTESGLHLRLTGLQHPLEMARTYPLTLEFEKGGVIEADLSVDYI